MMDKVEALRKAVEELMELAKGQSKDTLSKIQGIHDHATGLGAKCNKCDTAKADGAEELKKMQGEKDEALAKVETLTKERDDLSKAQEGLTKERDDLKKQLDETKAELAKKPEPPKGATLDVGKAADSRLPVSDTRADALKKIEEIKDPNERARELIKLAHQAPQTLG